MTSLLTTVILLRRQESNIREALQCAALQWVALQCVAPELCGLPQFDGISLRVMKTSEAPNAGVRFRVFDLNSCRA